ncbi:MAG: hypothetical protein HQK83_05980 [Fibrobacteria bacterium]|nr:hypothetical protein [Fibrobacteria bacterium]
MRPSLAVLFLCAGFGKRLAPLTEHIPKPLLPFLGRTALEINKQKIDKLKKYFTITKMVCNTHHLAPLVVDRACKLGIEPIHENVLLGTGGCISNAIAHLGSPDYLLVHNGDILHTVDLLAFCHSALQHKGRVAGHLVGISFEKVNSLLVDKRGILKGIKNYWPQDKYACKPEGVSGVKDDKTGLTYSGIALYHKSFFKYCENRIADIKPFWVKAIEAGEKIVVQDYSGVSWHDFGTPQSLWDTMKWRMEKQGEYSFNYPKSKKLAFVSNEGEVQKTPDNLSNIIIYEKPSVPLYKGMHHQIIGENFKWEIQ